MRRAWRWLTLPTGLLAACAPADRQVAPVATIAQADTIVAPEDGQLERPSAVTLDDAGRLWVIDGDALVVLDRDGAVLDRIGRAGAGPGEWSRPRSLRVAGDTVRVLDAGNGRIQVLTLEGDPVRTLPAPPGALSAELAFDDAGAMLVARNGTDSALAQRFAADGTPASRLGIPPADAVEVWDFGAIKREIAEGTVPGVLRNLTLPVLANDGSAWLSLHAEGTVERHDARDSLLWTATLPDSLLAPIREGFFAANRADSNPGRFTPLSFVVQAQPAGDSLWMLLRQPDDAGTRLVQLDPEGRIARTLLLPGVHGARGFALDRLRGSLYLLVYQEGLILRAALPPE